MTPKDTAEIREKLLEIWKQVDEKKISTSEARLHMGLARAILETIKVEIAAAHLARANIPSVTITHKDMRLPITRRAQQ